MIINHNIAALNTHRQLGSNNAQASKNLEKLSSGLKINRAGDDAAGLAISEKMRGQIRGLDMAQKNSQDAISLVQTAEGALNETHDILQRMRELAVQSSNDTNTESDRSELQKEVNQLASALDDIANNTEFNTKKLLNGEFKGTFHVGANENQKLDVEVSAMGSAALGLTSSVTQETGVAVTGIKDGIYTVKGTDLLDASKNVVGTVQADGVINNGKASAAIDFTNAVNDKATIIIKDGKAELRQEIKDDALKLSAGDYSIDGTNLIKDGQIVGKFEDTGNTIEELNGKAVSIGIADLGLATGELADGKSFTINSIDISSRDQADGAITNIQSAIDKVSSERSKLGAVQNRLEHTINNLGTSSENLTAAESRIRDVDYVLSAA